MLDLYLLNKCLTVNFPHQFKFCVTASVLLLDLARNLLPGQCSTPLSVTPLVVFQGGFASLPPPCFL